MTVRYPLPSFERLALGDRAQSEALVGEDRSPSAWRQNPPYALENWEHELQNKLLSEDRISRTYYQRLQSVLGQYSYMDERLRQQKLFGLRSGLAAAYDEYVRFRTYDCFIVSYPKSGRTWLRYMLGNFLSEYWHEGVMDVEGLSLSRKLFAGITFTHDDDPHLKHCSMVSGAKSHFNGKNVILLVRDPLDAVVSHFFQFHYRGGRDLIGMPLSRLNIDDFVFFEYGGLPNLIEFYNAWGRYLEVNDRITLIRYEDLRRDPLGGLKRLARVLGIHPDEDRLLRTVRASSFEEMRRVEINALLNDPRLLSGASGGVEALKTRRGVCGGYREYLRAYTISKARSLIREKLKFPITLDFDG